MKERLGMAIDNTNLFDLLNVASHGILLAHVAQLGPGVPLGLVDHVPECRLRKVAGSYGGLLVEGVEHQHHLIGGLVGAWKFRELCSLSYNIWCNHCYNGNTNKLDSFTAKNFFNASKMGQLIWITIVPTIVS